MLTSVPKNTGDAVVEIVESSMNDEFTNDPFIGTIENGGVDIAPYHDLQERVSPELAAEVNELRAAITEGTLEITSPSTPG